MTDGEWVVKQCSFIPLLPSESPSPSSNASDKARRGPPHKSLLVCEHSCRGDEKDEQHCMCVCTYSAFFFLLFSLPPSFFFGSLSPPCLSPASASHDHQFVVTLGALSSLPPSLWAWMGEEDEDRFRWQSAALAGCFAGEGWMPLRTQSDCHWGQGLTQSSCCVYMAPSDALRARWTPSPRVINVQSSAQEMLTVPLCYACFSPVFLKLWSLDKVTCTW